MGKYKRDALNPGEFEKFAHSIRTVRKYRHAFYESTGDRKPYPDRSYRTVKLQEKSSTEVKESEVTPSRRAVSETKRKSEPAKRTERRSQSPKPSFDDHQKSPAPRKSRTHSRRRHRWLRLSGSMLKEYRKVLALAALALFAFTAAIWWFANGKTTGTNSTGIFDNAPQGMAMSKTENWSKFAPASIAEGSVVSEADQLLSLVSGFSGSTPWSVPAPVQTSMEQAIWNELNTYFSRPEEAFESIKAPEKPLE